MASQKIRIKLSAYDHELVDQAAQLGHPARQAEPETDDEGGKSAYQH